jgi:hypothetical protein
MRDGTLFRLRRNTELEEADSGFARCSFCCPVKLLPGSIGLPNHALDEGFIEFWIRHIHRDDTSWMGFIFRALELCMRTILPILRKSETCENCDDLRWREQRIFLLAHKTKLFFFVWPLRCIIWPTHVSRSFRAGFKKSNIPHPIRDHRLHRRRRYL